MPSMPAMLAFDVCRTFVNKAYGDDKQLKTSNFSALLLGSLLCIAACDSSKLAGDFKIKGFFGYGFGETPRFIPDGYLADNQTFDAVAPTKVDPFSSYQITVTPGTHEIYALIASSLGNLTSADCLSSLDDISTRLTDQYAQFEDMTVLKGEDVWMIDEDKTRSISLACSVFEDPFSPSINGYQLSMIAQDKNLSTQAYKEWQERQTSPDKFK